MSLSPIERAGLTSFGSNAAIAVEALGSTGRWAAYCQPPAAASQPVAMPRDQRGQPTGPIAVHLGTAEGRFPIERLLAIDPRGRFVVVVQDRRTILWDTTTGHRDDLGALHPDLRDDGLADHRSFAFSHSGRYLVVLARSAPNGAPSTAHLLDLSVELPAEHARPLALGPDPVWRVTAEGEAFVFAVQKSDGAAAFPARPPTHVPLRCAAAVYGGYPRLSGPLPDPTLTFRLLLAPHRPTSPIVEAPGYVLALSDSWVRRTEEGRLLLVHGGAQRQIASAHCGARILHADATSGLFLVACEHYQPVKPSQKELAEKKKQKPEYRFDLFLLRPGVVRDLDADMMRTGVDLKATWEPLLVPIRPGPEQALVDFRTKKLVPLEPGETVLNANGKVALLRRGTELTLLRAGARELLASGLPVLSPILTEGPATAVGTLLIVLEDSHARTWRLSQTPVALSAGATALLPRIAATDTSWAMGPLLQIFPDGPAPQADASSAPTPGSP